MAALMPQGKQQYFTAGGIPLVGGKVYTYAAGTTTPLATYTTAAASTPNANPVILDSRGEASIFFSAANYKIVVKDSLDSTIWTQDNLPGDQAATILANLAASSGSSLVGHIASGTGAVATTVQTKLRELKSLADKLPASFNAATDDVQPYFQLIVDEYDIVNTGAGTYLFGAPVVISRPVMILGEGQSATNLHRNYSPVADTDGIFNIIDGGSLVGMRDMTLRSLTGQTGGCLLSIVSTAAGALGLFSFINMGFTTTGTSTHQYTIYMDGTAKVAAPIGIRGVDMFGCSVFGGGISTILAKGVLKWSFIGGGAYPAGGAAGSNVRISGSAAVPTSSFRFAPADCSCPISLDYTSVGVISCGTMGAITNTSNTTNIVAEGFAATVENNWLASTFRYTDYSSFMAVTNANLSNVTGDGTSYTVLFQTVRYSKGSSYDPGTGIFTVLRPGMYAVNWAVAYGALGAAHVRADTGPLQRDSGGSVVNSVVSVANPYVIADAFGNATVGGSINLLCAIGDTLRLIAQVSGGAKTVGITGSAGTVYSWFAAQYVGN